MSYFARVRKGVYFIFIFIRWRRSGVSNLIVSACYVCMCIHTYIHAVLFFFLFFFFRALLSMCAP